jgi:Zn-dependent protease with chaperone function
MFEHMKDENHILVILAHEMGHTINRDVIKIIIMRVLYYNVIFIGFIFPLKYR